MDGLPCYTTADWQLPDWLEQHQLPDARFAQAYSALADDRRALIKGLIARLYALAQPLAATMCMVERRYELFAQQTSRQPVPFVLLLLDHDLEAPALFLAALMPALCARAEQVLVCHMGKKSDVSDALLTACELAGQERVAALGPMLLQRLLTEAAASGEPGVVLHPQTTAFRKLVSQPALREALDVSPLRLVGLRPPRACGIWRDEAGQFPPSDVSLLYGPLGFASCGVAPASGTAASEQGDWQAFSSVKRELVLVPSARGGALGARVSVAENCLGQWCWPELTPELFIRQRQVFTAIL